MFQNFGKFYIGPKCYHLVSFESATTVCDHISLFLNLNMMSKELHIAFDEYFFYLVGALKKRDQSGPKNRTIVSRSNNHIKLLISLSFESKCCKFGAKSSF